MVDGKKLFKLLNEKIDIELKGNLLKEKALSGGGLDNITFVLLEK
jgi:serine/threonine protein phosphatase PrpC